MMNPKEKAILDRIKRYEDAISKGREYLETGAHADWSGFRPLNVGKTRDGKALPPHRDWVENVFLPRRERALQKALKTLEKLTQKNVTLANKSVAQRRGKAARGNADVG